MFHVFQWGLLLLLLVISVIMGWVQVVFVPERLDTPQITVLLSRCRYLSAVMEEGSLFTQEQRVSTEGSGYRREFSVGLEDSEDWFGDSLCRNAPKHFIFTLFSVRRLILCCIFSQTLSCNTAVVHSWRSGPQSWSQGCLQWTYVPWENIIAYSLICMEALKGHKSKLWIFFCLWKGESFGLKLAFLLTLRSVPCGLFVRAETQELSSDVWKP